MNPLKLGTRKSPLALAQSIWVRDALLAKNSSLKIELIGIETKGDQVLDQPLSEIEGKEFFTAELDRALLREEIDFTVHSFKDLSLERPSGIHLAATPERALPHDVLLLRKDVAFDRTLKIGTSSPRRNALIPKFLEKALPGQLNLQFVMLRGNINTRLSRLFESEDSERALDGVILALAGVERLAANEEHGKSARQMLSHLKPLLIPLKVSPTSPAQGALAVECLSARKDLMQILSTIHDAKTFESVTRERQFLKDAGGGCHQPLGATDLYGYGVLHKEIRASELIHTFNSSTIYAKPKTRPESIKIVRSEMLFDFAEAPKRDIPDSDIYFIAHARACTQPNAFKNKRVWCAGISTWEKLVAQGIFVEGSTEGLGANLLPKFLTTHLFAAKSVLNLTHDQTFDSRDFPTYSLRPKSVGADFFDTDTYFWTSGSQFRQALVEARRLGLDQKFLASNHASGPGKTALEIKNYGIQAFTFISTEEFLKWTRL